MGGARVSDYPGPTFLGVVCGAVPQPRGFVLAPSPSLFTVSIESGLDSRLRPWVGEAIPWRDSRNPERVPTSATHSLYWYSPQALASSHRRHAQPLLVFATSACVVPQAPCTAFTGIRHKRLRRPTGAMHSLYWYSPQALASSHRRHAQPLQVFPTSTRKPAKTSRSPEPRQQPSKRNRDQRVTGPAIRPGDLVETPPGSARSGVTRGQGPLQGRFARNLRPYRV